MFLRKRAGKIGTVRIEKVESMFEQLMMRLLVVVAYLYHILYKYVCMHVCMYVCMYVCMDVWLHFGPSRFIDLTVCSVYKTSSIFSVASLGINNRLNLPEHAFVEHL